MSLHEFAKICLSDSDGILSFSDSPIISQRNFAVLSSKKLSDIGFKPIDTKQSKIVRCVDAVREAICCVK